MRSSLFPTMPPIIADAFSHEALYFDTLIFHAFPSREQLFEAVDFRASRRLDF